MTAGQRKTDRRERERGKHNDTEIEMFLVPRSYTSYSHRSYDCPRSKPEEKIKCFICDQDGHIARNYENKGPGSDVKAGGAFAGYGVRHSEESDKERLRQLRRPLGQYESGGGTRRHDNTEEEETRPV